MFQQKTLFIVGAGASAEVGFPIGSELTAQIASELRAFGDRERPYNYGSGGNRIDRALARRPSTPIDFRELMALRETASLIEQAMPLAKSIDSYIDDHASDPNTELLGKLAIAARIFDAERGSQLFLNLEGKNSRLDWTFLSSKWFGKFFSILTAGRPNKNPETLFENISFIVFNYDRCIEQFILQSLMNYFRLPLHEASQILKRCVIKHPYGSLGPLDDSQSSVANVFGGSVPSERSDGIHLLNMAGRLKTFTERITEEAELAEIKELVQDARTIVFLGFAFHQQNMDLLDPGTEGNVERVFATMYRVPKPEQQILFRRIAKIMRQPSAAAAIQVEPTECSVMLGDYASVLS
jgi:hypothetical protein